MQPEHALAAALSASAQVDPDKDPSFPSTPEAVDTGEKASQGFAASLSFPDPQLKAQYNNDATYSKWRVTGVLFLPRDHKPRQHPRMLTPTPAGEWDVSTGNGSNATLGMTFDQEGDYTVGIAVDAAWTMGAERRACTGAASTSVKLSVIKTRLISQTVATAPKNKDPARTTIGVGEVVNLELEGTHKEIPIVWTRAPEAFADLKDLKPTVFNKKILTASDKEGKVTVTASYRGKQHSLTFTIVAPTGIAKGVIAHTLKPEWKLKMDPFKFRPTPAGDGTQPGAGMKIHNVVLPEEVSFRYIFLEEKDCHGTKPTGCYDPKNKNWNRFPVAQLRHKNHGALLPTRPEADNSVVDQDSAHGHSVWGSQWKGGGTWQWTVPLVWRLTEKGAQDHPFPVDWGTRQAKEAGWTCINRITEAGVATKTKNKALTTRKPTIIHSDGKGRVAITQQPAIVVPAKEIDPIILPLTLPLK